MTQKYDAVIIDGYVDEPSLLGVPPYLAPEPRYIAGVMEQQNLDWTYQTIDQVRKTELPKTKHLLVYGGVTVPGQYLGGTQLKKREAKKLAQTAPTTFPGCPSARYQNINQSHCNKKKDHSASYY